MAQLSCQTASISYRMKMADSLTEIKPRAFVLRVACRSTASRVFGPTDAKIANGTNQLANTFSDGILPSFADGVIIIR